MSLRILSGESLLGSFFLNIVVAIFSICFLLFVFGFYIQSLILFIFSVALFILFELLLGFLCK